MIDGEWTLAYPGTTLTVLEGTSMYLTKAPSFGDVEMETDDQRRPRMDGVAFGSDYRGGQTVELELVLSAETEAAALALKATFATAWRGDAVRRTPGGYATLATRNAGRERVMYGRPRRCTFDDALRPWGRVDVVCQFDCVDDLLYAPALDSSSVGFVPPPTGGLTSPLTSPLTSVALSSTYGGISVGGEMPTWPVVTFSGPVTNPSVTVVGLWTLTLLTSVGAGQSLTIDCRPWRRTVTRSDGASFAGALTRTSRLDRASIPPGNYSIAMGGIDSTGLSSMTFAWAKTYASL